MANILKGIDKIVTSDGNTTVDLANIQASGSGGSVSAAGLAISRSEDSTYIDYAFNEGGNPHAADGHSASASHMMVAVASPTMDLAILSFSDQNTHNQSFNAGTNQAADWGYTQACTGDNKMWIVGGLASSNTDASTIQPMSFTDSSEYSVWGNLGHTFALGTTTSNGTSAFNSGGRRNGSTVVAMSKFNFSDSSSVQDEGTLSEAVTYCDSVNDGQKMLVLGGADASSGLSESIVQHYQLNSGNQADSYNDLDTTSHINFCCNNTERIFLCIGYSSGSPISERMDEVSFNSGSKSSQFMSTTGHGYGGAMASNGAGEAILAGGYRQTIGSVATISKFSFDDSSSLAGYGSLNQARHHTLGSSGNA
jgi:hypothetical protein